MHPPKLGKGKIVFKYGGTNSRSILELGRICDVLMGTACQATNHYSNTHGGWQKLDVYFLTHTASWTFFMCLAKLMTTLSFYFVQLKFDCLHVVL